MKTQKRQAGYTDSQGPQKTETNIRHYNETKNRKGKATTTMKTKGGVEQGSPSLDNIKIREDGGLLTQFFGHVFFTVSEVTRSAA